MGMFDSIYAMGVKYQGLFGHDELQTKDLGLKLAVIELRNGKPVVVYHADYDELTSEELEPLENGKIWACQYSGKYRPWGDFNYYELIDWELTFKDGKLAQVSFNSRCKDVITLTDDPECWPVHPMQRIREMCYIMNMPGSRRKFTKRVNEVIRRHGIEAAHRYMDKKGILRVYANPALEARDNEFVDIVPCQDRIAAMDRAFAAAWNSQTAPMHGAYIDHQ